MAGSQAPVVPVEIRQLFHLEEFEDVLTLQQTIWSYEDTDLIPMRFLAVVARVGGHVFGAYDGPRMIGFCFAIPGIKPDGRPYLHSHMLGVLPEYRNQQIGRRLKLRQRDDALGRGIALIEWTFDPLELKNAFLNIQRLGAIVRAYKENQYGATTSPLHGGLPTDRCIAEWWIDSPRVRGILVGQALPPATGVWPFPADRAALVGHASACQASEARPGQALPPANCLVGQALPPANRHLNQELAGESACPIGRIAYPADIAAMRVEDNARAREIQQTNARLFLDAFSRGLAVTGFERTATVGAYLLEPWP